MLISHELETRILNINYLLKQLDVTEAQRGQLLLLGDVESELMKVYTESGSLRQGLSPGRATIPHDEE